jgi:hypothetical protein
MEEPPPVGPVEKSVVFAIGNGGRADTDVGRDGAGGAEPGTEDELIGRTELCKTLDTPVPTDGDVAVGPVCDVELESGNGAVEDVLDSDSLPVGGVGRGNPEMPVPGINPDVLDNVPLPVGTDGGPNNVPDGTLPVDDRVLFGRG